MSIAAVLDLLRTRIGLDPEALGPSLVPGVVAGRLRALGIADLAAYAALLAGGGEEFDTLVDEVIVPETWFFRGGASLFAHLVRHVRDAVAARPVDRPFRVLSAPCSSGEEPYSLAIALTEAQLPPGRWTIDAIDLSRRVLERARRGRYTALAFRETEPGLRQRYFRAVEGGWEIVPELRSAVRFGRANLVESQALAGAGPFDLVFCRNLLIYLDAAARARVLATLDRLLAPDGLLCTGHAEPLSLLDRQFRATGAPGFFLYRRGGVGGGEFACVSRNVNKIPHPQSQPLSAQGRAEKAPTPSPELLAPDVREAPLPDPLTQARRLADAGKLDQALASCRALLAGTGPSADLYSLMGVTHQARHERAEAAQCFGRALYLDPGHAEALTHLLLLHEEAGDSAGAARLRRRLKRTTAGGEP
jgi:chemotaxis protein methyltransferase WspC